MCACGTSAPPSSPAKTTGFVGFSSRKARRIGGSLIPVVIGSVWMTPRSTLPKRSSAKAAASAR